MAGSYGVADGTGPLFLHTSGSTTSGIATSGIATSGIATSGIATSGIATSGVSTSGISTSGIATSGTVSSSGVSGSTLGIGQLIPGISSTSTGTGILAGLTVVGGVLLTGALFAGVGLLSYAITKAAIEPESPGK